jgi:hypothetical protein
VFLPDQRDGGAGVVADFGAASAAEAAAAPALKLFIFSINYR